MNLSENPVRWAPPHGPQNYLKPNPKKSQPHKNSNRISPAFKNIRQKTQFSLDFPRFPQISPGLASSAQTSPVFSRTSQFSPHFSGFSQFSPESLLWCCVDSPRFYHPSRALGGLPHRSNLLIHEFSTGIVYI